MLIIVLEIDNRIFASVIGCDFAFGQLLTAEIERCLQFDDNSTYYMAML